MRTTTQYLHPIRCGAGTRPHWALVSRLQITRGWRTIHFLGHTEGWAFFGATGWSHGDKNEEMCAMAAKKGYDSIQFLYSGPSCGTMSPGTSMNYEIVSTKLEGLYTCASKDGRSPLIRSGWKGAGNCTCDNKLKHINCKDVPKLYALLEHAPRRVTRRCLLAPCS
mmetsp:Transcript_36798/g.83277  ORF Transcript_36798/g.83277 Transcript_36798/m.83277 type:complete len:166 (-) Transcript_36798:261-758(-)